MTTNDNTRRLNFGEDNDGCANEPAQRAALNDDYTRKPEDERITRARQKLADATTWRVCNPRAWSFIVDTAKAQADEGKQVSGRQLVEAVRKKDLTNIHGKPSRPNNDYAAVIARWLVKEYPELREAFEFRVTALDAVMGA